MSISFLRSFNERAGIRCLGPPMAVQRLHQPAAGQHHLPTTTSIVRIFIYSSAINIDVYMKVALKWARSRAVSTAATMEFFMLMPI